MIHEAVKDLSQGWSLVKRCSRLLRALDRKVNQSNRSEHRAPADSHPSRGPRAAAQHLPPPTPPPPATTFCSLSKSFLPFSSLRFQIGEKQPETNSS